MTVTCGHVTKRVKMASSIAPMCNGISRYIRPLKRLTFNYCGKGGSSKGTRDYLNSHVIQLAKNHPEVAFYVRPRKYRHPRLVAEYLNGNSQIVSLKNMDPSEIQWHVHLVCSSSGIKTQKLKKPWHTDNPSIQGTWSPFLHK
ncbi:PREDICTED: 39S ribosomal protein L43, mitochondrial-like [Amphimedon queenslandica]|uniref:Large ribosomal subunit protein mL43 n=1 Tax=Amphimedon queenslandica TaxID=400682 RepID=A0A1X7TZG9_AMPQE|nr:PREDICTED: 39S ribosomal protein L43, mitochondrial-like [Amphimedon queenslandica]|eukprot:XP_003389470.2 PREDICTED: 39S ribosomal protein L43, mitochondrial-like [Amphimedon queenslandica]